MSTTLNDHLPVVHYRPTPEGPTMNDMSPEPQPVTRHSLPAALLKRLEGMGVDTSSPIPDPFMESAEDAAARKAIQANNRSARWRERLPRDYAQAALADLDPEQGDVIRRWIADRDALTLVLAGNVGAGKTYAAYAIGNYAVAKGSWVECWNVYDLLTAIRPDGDKNAYQRAQDVALLVLDDLGTGKTSEWASDTLTTLLGARVAAGRRTVVTTNVPSAVLKDAMGERLASRLRKDSVAVVFAGDDRRVAAW